MTFKRLRAEQWGEGGGLDHLRGWQWGANEPDPEPDPAAALVALPSLIGAWDADRDASITTDMGVAALASTYTAVPFVQADTARQPTRETGGPYGRRFLRLDGTDDYLATAAQGWTAPQNVLKAWACVPSRSNGAGKNQFGSLHAVTPTFFAQAYIDTFNLGGANRAIRLFNGSGGYGLTLATTTTQWQVIVVRCLGTNDSKLWIARMVGGVLTVGSATATGIGDGWANYVGTSAYSAGKMYYGAAQTNPETAVFASSYADSDLGELWAWKAADTITDEDIEGIIIPYLTGRWIE